MAPTCSNCGASDFVWANELKTGQGLSGSGTLSLRSRGEIPVGTRICRSCGHADLFLRDLSILHKPSLWRPGEFVPIVAPKAAPKSETAHHGAHHAPAASPESPPAAPVPEPMPAVALAPAMASPPPPSARPSAPTSGMSGPEPTPGLPPLTPDPPPAPEPPLPTPIAGSRSAQEPEPNDVELAALSPEPPTNGGREPSNGRGARAELPKARVPRKRSAKKST